MHTLITNSCQQLPEGTLCRVGRSAAVLRFLHQVSIYSYSVFFGLLAPSFGFSWRMYPVNYHLGYGIGVSCRSKKTAVYENWGWYVRSAAWMVGNSKSRSQLGIEMGF